MDRGKVKQALELVGLTPIDADIYLYVSANPNCRAGRIISELDLNRSKVYDSLNKLSKMGLVSCVLTNYVKRYASTGPEMLRRTYESKSEAMGETINYLSSLGIQDVKGLKLRMVEGEEGYKSVKEEFLSQLKKGEEMLIIGTPSWFSSASSTICSVSTSGGGPWAWTCAPSTIQKSRNSEESGRNGAARRSATCPRAPPRGWRYSRTMS